MKTLTVMITCLMMTNCASMARIKSDTLASAMQNCRLMCQQNGTKRYVPITGECECCEPRKSNRRR